MGSDGTTTREKDLAESLQFETECRVEDWTACIRFVQSQARAAIARASALGYVLYLGVAAVVFLGIGYLVGVLGFEIGSVIFGLAAGLLFVLITLARHALRARDFQSAMAPRPGGSFLGTHRFVLGESGLRVWSPAGESTLRWEAVLGVHETSEHLFVMLDTSTAIVIPKRCLVRPSPLQVRGWIERHAKLPGRAAGAS